MKAAVYDRYGPPEVLHVKEMPKPTPKANEVLIRIRATTVNRTDCGFRKPEYGFIIRPLHGLFRPRKHILGSELSGKIEAVGQDVKTLVPGDEVFGLTASNFGAHAEYTCMPEDGTLAKKPANVSHEEAAAVCDGLMLGLNYVKHIDFRTAKEILVYGASGSIGTACVQLAKHYGGTVTAVCSTKSLDLLRTLGADRVIDYTATDFTKTGQVYDVVIDAVGKSSFFRCKGLLKPDGVYFSTDLGFLGQNLWLPLLTAIFHGRKVRFPVPKVTKEEIVFFKELIEAGRYRAVIDRRYPLDQIVEAARYVETGQKTGNVVLVVSSQ